MSTRGRFYRPRMIKPAAARSRHETPSARQKIMKSNRDPSAKGEGSFAFAGSFMRRSAWLLGLTLAVSSLTGLVTVSLFAFVFQVVAGRYLAELPWPATFILLAALLISSRTISALAM